MIVTWWSYTVAQTFTKTGWNPTFKLLSKIRKLPYRVLLANVLLGLLHVWLNGLVNTAPSYLHFHIHARAGSYLITKKQLGRKVLSCFMTCSLVLYLFSTRIICQVCLEVYQILNFFLYWITIFIKLITIFRKLLY